MTRILSNLTAMLFPLLMAATSFAQSPGAAGPSDLDRWGMSTWGGGWGHMMFGGVMMIVFWGGIILLVVLLARGVGGLGIGTNHHSAPGASPLDILKARFANGEIDEKEYRARIKILSE